MVLFCQTFVHHFDRQSTLNIVVIDLKVYFFLLKTGFRLNYEKFVSFFVLYFQNPIIGSVVNKFSALIF